VNKNHASAMRRLVRSEDLSRGDARDVDILTLHIDQLHAALHDAIRYIDCDNLTMQTKMRHWRAVLDGKPFNPANCEVTR